MLRFLNYLCRDRQAAASYSRQETYICMSNVGGKKQGGVQKGFSGNKVRQLRLRSDGVCPLHWTSKGKSAANNWSI